MGGAMAGARTLPAAARADLEGLRAEVRRVSGTGIAWNELLPACERFDGNMYRHIPEEVWESRDQGVEVLFASGLLGLVASRDPVPRYDHSMAESTPPFGKLNRWGHSPGLPDPKSTPLNSSHTYNSYSLFF